MQVPSKDKWTAEQWYAKVSDQHEYASGPGNDECINRAFICRPPCLREHVVPHINGAEPGQSEQSISNVKQATRAAVRVLAGLR
jgi:hypothetical protein